MFQPALPPGFGGSRQFFDGMSQALGNRCRHVSLRGVMAQQFLGGGEFAGLVLLGGRMTELARLVRTMFGFLFHTASSGLGKMGGECFASAM